MREYDRNEERTGVQEAGEFDPIFDVQSDFVMVYGFHNLKNRIKKWKKAGYVIHLMTGVSWGNYQDYLYGRWDGVDHHDEGQRNPDGSERGHGVDVPYMVPSNSFAHYLAEQLKYAVDCGIDAIHLEEPEFWVNTGYSDAFKREWRIYYKEEWSDPQSSCDAQYKASKLKQYLYTRTLDRLCSELKEYAMVKYNRLLRFYVPTHSLLNYSQWKIVSPESALIDLPTIDGYIAQIWTGTSRTANVYRGVKKERTFETAFMEYGIMQELVRGTGRRMWFLADPIEDDPRHTWTDYRTNYYKTLVASLFHPEISDYEVSPWPQRVMRGRHLPNEETLEAVIKERKEFTEKGGNPRDFKPSADYAVGIPGEYKSNLLSVMHTLRAMKDETEIEWISDTKEIGILIGDSAMFQRICPAPGGDDGEEFSSFYGLAMPLLKAGLSARPVQLDNIRRFPGYLNAYKYLILSYEFMKPLSPDVHQGISAWVKNGGKLIIVGDGSDPFCSVAEWWKDKYSNPYDHLCEQIGIAFNEGKYAVSSYKNVPDCNSSGEVLVIKKRPYDIANDAGLSDTYKDTVLDFIGASQSSAFILRRGCYIVTSVVDEVPDRNVVLSGRYVNLFDSELAVVDNPKLYPGTEGLWYDLSRADLSESSDIIAISGRAEKIVRSQRMLSFSFRGPSVMTSAVRVITKRPVKYITVDGKNSEFVYDPESRTTYFTFESEGKLQKIKIGF